MSRRSGRPRRKRSFRLPRSASSVAATAALTLVDHGLLALDDDVNAKLRTWKVPSFRFDQKVPLRRLLSHTAGAGCFMTFNNVPVDEDWAADRN